MVCGLKKCEQKPLNPCKPFTITVYMATSSYIKMIKFPQQRNLGVLDFLHSQTTVVPGRKYKVQGVSIIHRCMKKML